MAKDPAGLRKKFANHVLNKWIMNNHDLKEISAVYVILALHPILKTVDVFYVGSTTNLFRRYKSHKVPAKVQDDGLMNLLFFLPMEKGFYDYEIKLIKKLKPKYNRQHKCKK